MQYRGKFELFDLDRMKTYPLRVRPNKVDLDNQMDCEVLARSEIRCSAQPWFRNGLPGEGPDQGEGLEELASYLVRCRRQGKPVIVISGAHIIKNGEISIVIDLIRRGLVTLYSTNVAGCIHSFELALTGASSESVRDALPRGEFGMAFETGHYLNNALRLGFENGIGFGEAMCRLYADASFRREVIERTFRDHEDTGEYYKPFDGFPFGEKCVFTACAEAGIPACVHASIGTDIIDQHDSFDGEVKGALSGADFLIFANELTKFTEGGVVLNIGTAVMGPEVLLKAASMAANIGRKPSGLWTGDFDLRPFVFDDETRDEARYYYYLRDQKSVATRIPKVFDGVGFYFQGRHAETLPPFYQFVRRSLGV